MFVRVTSLVLFSSLLPATGNAANDYRDGLEAVQRSEYATARKSFLNSAQRGHAASQSALGMLALVATDQPANTAEALGWLLAAQENRAAGLDAHLAKARAGGAEDSDEMTRGILEEYGRAAIQENWLPASTHPSFNPCKAPDARKSSQLPAAGPAWQHLAIVLVEYSRGGRLVDFHPVFRLPSGTNKVKEEIYVEAIGKRERTHPTAPSNCRTADVLVVSSTGPKSNKQEILDAAIPKAENGDAEALFTVGMANNAPNDLDLIGTAAQAGYPGAQYYLSRQLPNPELARKWLELAAEGGVAAAQVELAEAILASDERSSQLQKVRSLLERAATNRESYVMVRIAAIRAAAPDEQLRDARFALNAVRDFELKKWPMPIRFEAAALSHAASGDFKAAIRFEERAIDAAEAMGHDTARMQERLKAYTAKQMWFGYLATEYR